MDEDNLLAYIESSKKDKLYAITGTPDGGIRCECDGFKWRNKCRHVKEYKEKYEVVLKVRVIFSDPDRANADIIIPGREVHLSKLKFGDVTTGLGEVEAVLSRVTGMAVRVETETL